MNILVVDDNPILRKTYRADPTYLASKCHKVTVVCPKPFQMKEKPPNSGNVRFVFTIPWKPIKNNKDLLNKLIQIALNVIYLRRILRAEKYDVVRAVGFISAYSALIARGKLAVPVVSNLTDFYSDMYRQYMLFGASFMTRLLERMQTQIVRKSDVLFVDSPTMRRYWKHWGLNETKCVVLPNGFDDDLFHAGTSSTKIKAKYGIQNQTKIVLYAGDISMMDGLDILIEAATQILKEIDAVFLILGSGTESYLSSLKTMVKRKGLEKQIIFIGWIPYASVPEFMAAADVCVAPFRITLTSNSTECLKVVEYTAMMKPVVATKADGLEELFGDVLIYVPPEDAQALADAVIKTLRQGPLDAETAKKMKVINEKFAWKNIWKNEERIMQSLVENDVHDFRVFDIF